MKLLKAVMTGTLSVFLLGTPLGNLPIDSGINRVEASTQVKAMYAKTQLDAYKGRSSKSERVMTVPYGVRIDRLTVHSSWSQVRYNGRTGWVASRDLVEIKKTEVLDTTRDVTLYASRSTKAKVVTKVPANKQVTRSATNKSWSQVTYGAKTGWVASSHLKARYTKETFAPRAYQVKEEAPLQATHATNGKVLTSLPKEIIIASAERYNSWYKVTFNKKTGWVNGKYLTPYKAPTTGPAEPKPGEPPVNVDSELKEKARAMFGSSFEYFSESKNEVFAINRETRETFSYADTMIVVSEDDKTLLKAIKFVNDIHGGGDPNEILKRMKIADSRGIKYGNYTIYRHAVGAYKIAF